jgi:16S rRNA (guanine527-N7)-methyltransferase
MAQQPEGDNRVSGSGGKAGERTLEGWAERFGVELSPVAREGLLAYGGLLLSWGDRINLTAAKSREALIGDHLPDSFAIAARLNRRGAAGGEIVDVGSGGGLPAIPLALLRPNDRFTLIEATGKKVAFLRTAVREMGLADRVRVEHRRMGRPGEETRVFDIATSRAMLAPAEWMRLARHLVRVGGSIFCLGTAELATPVEGLRLVDASAYRPDRWVTELERST